MATVSKPPASRDVSPKTIPIPSHPKTTYHETAGSTSSARTNDSIDSLSDRKSSTTSDTAPLAAVARGPMTLTTSNNTSSKDDDGLSPTTATTTPTDGLRRHSSVSIQLPNTALPQGTQKGITKGRLRNASPDHHRCVPFLVAILTLVFCS